MGWYTPSHMPVGRCRKPRRITGLPSWKGWGFTWAVKHFRPYLYGQKCTVYTDHQALKSLLNTPQPSARWGMALQELDLCIQHRSGKANSNADALSLPSAEDENLTEEVVAAVQVEDIGTPAELEKGSLSELQRRDGGLTPLICYLEDRTLPDDEKLARRIAMTGSQSLIEDDALYRIEADSTLRVVVPEECRKKLFEEVHGGRFGAHLSDVKVHSELRRHYWWTGMRRDITSWTRACLFLCYPQSWSEVQAATDANSSVWCV